MKAQMQEQYESVNRKSTTTTIYTFSGKKGIKELSRKIIKGWSDPPLLNI